MSLDGWKEPTICYPQTLLDININLGKGQIKSLTHDDTHHCDGYGVSSKLRTSRASSLIIEAHIHPNEKSKSQQFEGP
jgi:hypothetical protein